MTCKCNMIDGLNAVVRRRRRGADDDRGTTEIICGTCQKRPTGILFSVDGEIYFPGREKLTQGPNRRVLHSFDVDGHAYHVPRFETWVAGEAIKYLDTINEWGSLTIVDDSEGGHGINDFILPWEISIVRQTGEGSSEIVDPSTMERYMAALQLRLTQTYREASGNLHRLTGYGLLGEDAGGGVRFYNESDVVEASHLCLEYAGRVILDDPLQVDRSTTGSPPVTWMLPQDWSMYGFTPFDEVPA